MIFSKHNSSSRIFFFRGSASRRFRLAVYALALAAAAVSLTRLHSLSAQARQKSAPEPGALYGAAAFDRLKQDGQYESLQAAMLQARFGVSRAEATPLGRAAWHAPNRAAGYDAYVTESGVSIAVTDKTFVSLSLHSLGYGAAMQGVAPGEVSGAGQTINIMREGGVQEWYVNSPDGLEQGFTLTEPPGARHPGVPLRLALQVSEGWRAAASDGGKAVILSGAGVAIEYGKLVVRDSEGRGIPARLTVAGEQVVIEAEDSDAAYPLTIDPLFTLQQKLLAADGASYDNFGSSVALEGATLVVGASGDTIGANSMQGSIYVFTRSGAVWTQQQKLTASDGRGGANFGCSVALDGDTLVVGAYQDGATISTYGKGSAYVFTRSGTVWTQQQKLIASDGAGDDRFGFSVAISGDTVVVGAYFDDIGANVDQGSAYVFTRSNGVWTQQQKVTANDGAGGDEFGLSVALVGDTLVAGAQNDTIGANFKQGSAYVFTRSGVVWTQQQKLTANDGAADDFFGVAVALGVDTVAVGARDDNIGANLGQGSAYIFTRSGTVWTQQQKVTANDGGQGDQFGYTVKLRGDTLVVGAPNADIGANAFQGSVYVFTRAGGVWTQQQKLIADDGEAADYFGRNVALSDDTVMVGQSGDMVGANLYQGSVYVFSNWTCPAITLSPASLPNGASGASYQQQITASGGAGPYQFGLISAALPPGLSLMTNGLLSGVLTTPGTYNFTIGATDLSSGCTGNRAYTITVIPPCATLTIDPPALPAGAKGAPYSVTLTAIGGIEPYTFSMKGKLPPGLSLSANGVLSGTPKKAGTFAFTLLVSDARGCTGSRADSITIVQGNIEIGVNSSQGR